MKKIFVDRNEPVASVVERIIGDADPDITLVVPKNAVISESVSNFHLLKREAGTAQKNVVVESVDEGVLALAKASKLESSHPLLRGNDRPRSLLDIAPRRGAVGREPETEEEAKPRRTDRGREKEEEESGVHSVSSYEEAAPPAPPKVRFSFRLPSWRPRLKFKMTLWIAVPLALVVIGGWVVGAFFSRATITITFKKAPWLYEGNFAAETSAVKPVPEKNILPGELFTQQKNLTQLFGATGNREVSQKARGKITVYNAYSSAAQVLVATTRFITPDGKIFRLVDKVTVPGAKVTDGRIIPASIEAEVVANQAGPEYNLGPAPRLEVPGFQGSPRYGKFYGELKEATAGGFIGKRAVPTSDDIAAAREKTSQVLQTGLESGFLTNRPQGFVIPEGASEVKTTRLTVNENTDSRGNFNVFGEATFRALGFREEDLKSFLQGIAAKSNPDTIFEELNLSYKDVQPDFKQGRLTFSLSATGTLQPPFSSDEFKAQILGKDVDDVRSLILNLPALENAKISLWPFWLGRIPARLDRVEASVH